MAEKNNNYILIGMPGSGKSTIGVLLAKALGYDFVDTDLVIQQKGGGLLKEIIARIGNDGFKQLEEDVNVAPFVGVWIEIIQRSAPLSALIMSIPSQECRFNYILLGVGYINIYKLSSIL